MNVDSSGRISLTDFIIDNENIEISVVAIAQDYESDPLVIEASIETVELPPPDTFVVNRAPDLF